MQRSATRVFIASSIAFGILGAIFFILIGFDAPGTELSFALWGISGCVVLTSFALSVAGKYLTEPE